MRFGIRIYLLWFTFLVVAVLPSIIKFLLPLRRILCWIAPLVLALDVDAGNRRWIYIAKAAVWVPLQICALVLLKATHGLQEPIPESQKVPIYTAIVFLFFASCVLTIIGHWVRRNVWVNNPGQVSHGSSLRLVDKTVLKEPYANYKRRAIRTRLKLEDLNRVWNSDKKRYMTTKEVSDFVLRTSFATQFVMTRTFISTDNKVYVYSPVTQYRAVILSIALLFSGVMHVLEGLFEKQVERDIVQSLLLWLTLPTITIPALLKIKFGNNIKVHLLLAGLLPVDTDVQMWRRLGVGPNDLYSALANAVYADNILKQEVGLVNTSGMGTVHVTDVHQARKIAKDALLQVGNWLIRVSDGERIKFYEPGEAISLSRFKDSDKYESGEAFSANSQNQEVRLTMDRVGARHITEVAGAHNKTNDPVRENENCFIRVSDGKTAKSSITGVCLSSSEIEDSGKLSFAGIESVALSLVPNNAAGSEITSENFSTENGNSSCASGAGTQKTRPTGETPTNLSEEAACNNDVRGRAIGWPTFGGVIGSRVPIPEWVTENYEDRPYLCRFWLRHRERRYYRDNKPKEDVNYSLLQYLAGLFHDGEITYEEFKLFQGRVNNGLDP